MQASNEQFRLVVLPHLDHAYRLARYLTGSSDDSQDVVQEAMVRMIRSIDGYRGGDARAWVLAVIRNTSWSWLRTNRRSGHVPFGEDLGNSAEPGLLSEHGVNLDGDPAKIELKRSESKALRAAIAELPRQQRELVVLRDLQGLSYREIAATLYIPIGTVMSRLSRAHRALERSLGHEAAPSSTRAQPRRFRYIHRTRSPTSSSVRRTRRAHITTSWQHIL